MWRQSERGRGREGKGGEGRGGEGEGGLAPHSTGMVSTEATDYTYMYMPVEHDVLHTYRWEEVCDPIHLCMKHNPITP